MYTCRDQKEEYLLVEEQQLDLKRDRLINNSEIITA
jgi:hypothetical protein